MKEIVFSTREEWSVARRGGIGGSDVPAILGLSPWRTPMQVWADKVGLEPPREDSYTLRRGLHMERLLAGEIERAIEETRDDDSLIASFHPYPPHRIVEGDEPWMLYSADGSICVRDKRAVGSGTLCLVEFKSHPRGASEWSEAVPPHVVAQVQWGMVVCDLPRAYVGVDLGTEFRWAALERDPEWIVTHLPRLREFWRLVETQTPPEPTADEGDRAVIGRMFPAEQAGKTVPLDAEALDLAWQLDAAEKVKREAEEQIEEIKNRIRMLLGDAERGVLPDGSGWTFSTVTRKEHVVKSSSSRVLRRYKAKE